MSPLLTRTPIFRTTLQRGSAGAHQLRFASLSSKVPVARGGQAAWSGHWRNTGGVAMMYFPVVAVVMFWPYAVPPVMDYVEARL